MKKYSFLLLGLMLILSSCATIPKTEESLIDKPQDSNVQSKTPPRFLKRKVAIARFTNETKYGQSFFAGGNKENIGKQATDILSAKLASTDKFILLERSDISKVIDEFKMSSLSNVDIKNINLMGADYLIVGSISEFGRKEVSDVGVFSRSKKQVAYAKVNIRLIDIYTGQIIYASEGDGEVESEATNVMGLGKRAGYDSSLNDKVISAAISKMVGNIVTTLLDKPWRSYILSYENGNFIISGGKTQGIKKDDEFAVYKKGNRVQNPQTNMMIELPGQVIGKIKVQTLAGLNPNNEIAVCSCIDGKLPNNDFSEIYIQELDKR